ncbi:MAG: ATP-binding protein [Polyangiaceae bacterium]
MIVRSAGAVPLGKTLEIRLLGELEVVEGGRKLALPASKKTRALLGYLVATGSPHLRERLCDLLWQGPDDPRAALRWSLTKIRVLLDSVGVKRVVADREHVAFEPKHVQCDWLAARAAVQGGAKGASIEALRDVAASFRGELLEGLDLADAYLWHEWCVSEREAARSLRTQVLTALIERGTDDPEGALAYAREHVRVDPLSEAAHAQVVRLLTELGRKQEAEQQYETCRRILANELGAKPSARLIAARARSPSGPTPSAQGAGEAAPTLPSLVGRDEVLRDLDAHVEAATLGRVEKTLLVTGEPGIGKTRVLEELATRIRAAGGRVLRGRAFEAEMVRPYGAWIDALRSISIAEAAGPLRAELAPLLPELQSEGEGTPDKALLFDAVARLVATLAVGAPVAVLLDDIQWFDEASAALLHFVARAVAPSSVLFACGARVEELAENPAAVRLVRAMQREGRVHEVELAPLDAAATAALARAVHAPVDSERVVRESSGNPLFALEVARALAQGGAPLSRSLLGLITDRLARLDERAHELVQWAAALGHGFDIDMLQRVTELPQPDLVDALEELERRGILRSRETPGGVGYDFVHDLIRAGAYRQLSAPRRRWVHLRIALALRELARTDTALAGDVAHHAALGGDSELAARACLDASERCLRLFANDEAARVAEIATPHLARLRREVRLPLHLALLRVKAVSGRWLRRKEELSRELTRAVLEAQDAGLVGDVSAGFHTMSILQHDAGDLLGAHESTLRAVDAGRTADPLTHARQLSLTARCLGLLEREMDRVEAMLGEAERIRGSVGESCSGDLMHEWGHGILALYVGDESGGVARLERALVAARREQDRWAECDCLIRMTQVELDANRPSAALARCRELAPVAAKMGEGSERPVADALDALARVAACVPGAEEHLARASSRLREIDAKGMLSYVLVATAQFDLRATRLGAARVRAEEGLRAAEAVGRRSQVALARSVLARVALAEGDPAEAARHVEAVGAEAEGRFALSARARDEVVQARASIEQALS